MSTAPTTRRALALVLLSVALAGCGRDLGADAAPQPVSEQVALSESAPADDSCGTAERPCLLPEIRVNGAEPN
jgi:hypothetical protein